MNILDSLRTVYEASDKPRIKSAEDVFNQMSDIKDAQKEIFVTFYLNTKNETIAKEIISIGILNASLIHPRETFRTAVILNANSIIVAHNHPSGDTEPSFEDKEVTKILCKAGEILGIKVLDHVIVNGNNFRSLKEDGVI